MAGVLTRSVAMLAVRKELILFDNFLISVGAVFPMMVLMGIGIIVRKAGIVNIQENKHFNRMIFVVFFPMMMFSNLYGIDLGETMDWSIVVYGVLAISAVILLSIPFACKVEQAQESRGAMIQAIYRSNFVIMGLPIVANFYGHGNLAVTAMMVSVIVPFYNVMAVVILETFRGGKIRPLNILKQIIKNPLIVGGICGILAAVTGLKLPGPVESLVDEMGMVATPMALVILGISFDFSSVGKCRRNLFITVMGKLVVVPGIFLTLAAILGFRGIEFVTLIAVFATPASVSSFTMAESMGSDSQLAGNSVIISSIVSCFTIFLWVFVFKSAGIF